MTLKTTCRGLQAVYQTAEIDGIEISYREAGPKDALTACNGLAPTAGSMTRRK